MSQKNLERRLRRISEAGRELGLGEPAYYMPKPKPEKKARYVRHSSNPNGFTTDEYQTATLLATEGASTCFAETKKGKKYLYPQIKVRMCDKEALLPAARALQHPILASRQKKTICPPHLFPPEGKGAWLIVVTGSPAQKAMQRLNPLLTTEFKRKWQQTEQRCQ